MRGLTRLVSLTAATALLLSGTVMAFSFVIGKAVHQSASAQELVLPSLVSQMQVGSTVYADDSKTVLAVLTGPQLRKPVDLDQVSKTMITAALDTEDHNFYLHGGFSIASMARAAIHDTSGAGLQGGSTIAQQLVKQLYLSPTQKLSRKIKEAVLADRLEQKYTKDQILQAYLNTIPLGNGAYGVEAASETYFRESASQLDLAQAALLAGMIQEPTGYDPILQPAAARDRRAQVLDRMVFYHDITPDQAAAANAVPLPTIAPPPVQKNTIANYYVQEVRDELLAPGSPLGSTYQDRYNALFEGGLQIYTNLDPPMQASAEQAVANDTPSNSGGFQEALVSVDPATGKVKALVGGTGTANSQFDIITQGARQPGSGFKLFTLLAALQQGYSVYDSVDSQSPCAIKFPGDNDLLTKPINNDSGPGGGVIDLVSATADSVNCAFVRLAHEVGLPNVINMAHQLGVTENIPQYPSIVIGSYAVHPLEMAGAYAAVANGGIYHKPTFIDHIVDRTGAVIYTGADPGHRVFSSQIAAEADVAFQAVVQYGTGTAAALYDRQVAGKTGTTENNVDAWFNGFTPQIETTVWMGNVRGEVPIYVYGSPVYGANYPAETWRTFDSAVLDSQPAISFPSVSNGLLPPTHYVTSQSLVNDDVSDHNSGYYQDCSGYYAFGCSPPTTTPAPPPTQAPPAATTPATNPSRGGRGRSG